MNELTRAKFKENGDFNTFKGNTVVANLYHQMYLVKVVDKIQDIYRQLPFADKITLTPPRSIHMTVIELVCDKNRKEPFWSTQIPLDMPIDKVNQYFGEKLTEFPFTKENLTMKVVGMGRQNILLEPADEQTKIRLDEIREYVALQTGVRFPNHNNYQFHVTIGYIREELTTQENDILEQHCQKISEFLVEHLKTISISRVDYTTFEDMSLFSPYYQ